MKNTIIENKYQHTLRICKMQNNFYIDQCQNHTLYSFFQQLHNDQVDDNLCLIKIYDTLQEIKDQLKFFKNMITDTQFIKQVYNFYDETIMYEIDIASLEESSIINKEIKIILTAISSIETKNTSILKSLKNSYDFSNVSIDPSTVENLYDKKLVDYLLLNNATLLTNESKPCINALFNRSVNTRIEIEKIAQYICINNIKATDINLVLCNYTDDILLVKSIFERYNIPCFSFLSTQDSLISTSFIKIFEFLKNKSIDNLKNVVNTICFNNDNTSYFNKYLDLFIEDIEKINSPFAHVQKNLNCDTFKYESKKYLQLEQKAELFRTELSILFRPTDNIFIDTYEIIKNSKIINNQIFEDEILKIKQFIETYIDHTSHDKYDDLLLSMIRQIKKTKDSISQNAIIITDLKNPIIQNKYSFIIGCNQKNFPNFSSKSGIFDEDYCSAINDFPTLQSRQTFNLDFISWIHTSGLNIQYSYSLSNYEGKHFDPSIEICSMLDNKFYDIPLQQSHYINSCNITNISPDNAKQLFFKDNVLHGSVSRFERYYSCPFSFFIKYGLKINEDLLTEFDIANLGTIQHSVFEKLINKFGKNYTNDNDQIMYDILISEFENYNKLYNKHTKILDVIMHRTYVNLKLVLQFLSQMEIHTEFVPSCTELNFEDTIFQEDDYTINLKGVIDRVDTYGDIFKIIDYKSSNKNITKNCVNNGTQLQLLTYMHVLSKQKKMTAAGIYYIPLSYKDISLNYGTLNLRSKEYNEITKADFNDIFIKNNKVNGWHFLSTSLIDSSSLYVKSINKTGVPNPSSIKDINILSNHIDFIYKYLLDELKIGAIKCTPVNGACDYCDYKPICRFQSIFVNSIISDDKKQDFFSRTEDNDEV